MEPAASWSPGQCGGQRVSVTVQCDSSRARAEVRGEEVLSQLAVLSLSVMLPLSLTTVTNIICSISHQQ